MTATDVPVPALSARVLRQLGQLARLAGPTIISRAGILTMVMADVVMVGRYGTDELAYVSLGSAIFVPLLVIGVGLMVGVTAITAQTFGAGRPGACGAIWYRALPFALTIGLISAVICLFGEPILRLFGQSETLAREGGRVAVVLAPGLIGYSFFVASTFFLEGMKRPGPGMLAMLAANVLNIFLNWVFIFGNLGAPAMGAVGSGIVTSIVRIFLGVVIIAYILSMSERGRMGIDGIFGRGHFTGWWANSARVRAIGYAGGVAIAAQTVGFSILTQFAGLLGVVPVAAYTIAYNVESVVFMGALGIASATGVLVGNAWGRDERSEAQLAGWTGLGATIVLTILFGLAVAVFREPIAGFYSADPTVIGAALTLLVLTGMLVVVDSAQLTVAQSVRSLGDTWAAAGRYVIAFIAVMLPLAWGLAFGLEMGAAGLFLAMIVACAVSLFLQVRRFSHLVRYVP